MKFRDVNEILRALRKIGLHSGKLQDTTDDTLTVQVGPDNSVELIFNIPDDERIVVYATIYFHNHDTVASLSASYIVERTPICQRSLHGLPPGAEAVQGALNHFRQETDHIKRAGAETAEPLLTFLEDMDVSR